MYFFTFTGEFFWGYVSCPSVFSFCFDESEAFSYLLETLIFFGSVFGSKKSQKLFLKSQRRPPAAKAGNVRRPTFGWRGWEKPQPQSRGLPQDKHTGRATVIRAS